MDSESPTYQRRYDLTMSRRTRKPLQFLQAKEKPITVSVPTLEDLLQVKEGENRHKSLKQLINGDDKEKELGQEAKGRNSLSQIFNQEEKHLQLVKRQQQGGLQGLKFKKLVHRFTKVLSHLMKAKHDPHIGESVKKPMFKLPM
ncbi:hypothetical protein L6164_022940 [Bauhinia variegata]|uniref:Uncharacterized protein n=1 Tax=Bauhinia variegata TaxID=167791 RepID=A0ACB9MHM4_BAUVA|nr:hypothetical protein L6164_022940 [Bauhinia variegata]